MPPKKPPKTTSSSSTAIITTGPKVISAKVKYSSTKRDENGDKPTTVRAMVLRNGKYGARGTGEVMLASKLSGREKLDLLAEDLIAKSKTAVLSPFNLEKCLKMAESQFDAYLDDIANLQDSDLFGPLIEVEVKARTPTPPPSKRPPSDPTKNPSYIASIISTRIHNAYTLASAWKVIYSTLSQLTRRGLQDRTVVSQLQEDDDMRTLYLVLYDMVNVLVTISQNKFSVLATTTEHYARYFKKTSTQDPDDAEMTFDTGGLREACKSFLDSIIIELSFPQAPYPKWVLYQILHDAVDESPKEAKRFPQPLWDAIGDLSVALELQGLLERPLLGPNGDLLKAHPRQMPEDYERWVDAQFYSQKASAEIANYKDLVFPLSKTKNKSVLENMWKHINLNYKSVSGEDIDTLWGLQSSLRRAPEWHAFYLPNARNADSEDEDDDDDGPPALAGPRKKKMLALQGADQDSDGSMPELQSVSNSSDDDDASDDSDSEDEFTDSDGDESGYDTEQEDELRDMLRDAMDTAIEADFFTTSGASDDIKPKFEDNGNPFLKLLGSLRGRMFSQSPKLKPTTNRTAPRGAKPGFFSKTNTAPRAGHDVLPSAQPAPSKNQKATVEDAEDEDAPHTVKKKKKKPKKKKKKTTETEATPASPIISPASPVVSPPAPAAQASSPPPAKKVPVKSPPPAPRPASVASQNSVPAYMSSVSLPESTAAQSARSYLQSENVETKTKVKTRADHASLFPIPEKKSLLSRWMGKKDPEPPKEGARHSWFSKLGKKTNTFMHQLLNTSEDDTKGTKPMKWENFLKLMREMGFDYDPSTAGSSVRFDPPDKRDRSITFHKPHPDPTLTPIMLKEFSKKLRRYYGWCEEDFIRSKK